MSKKFSQPYQPLLLRILHGLIGLVAIAAIVTAFWTYDVYDGRWGRIPLPEFTRVERKAVWLQPTDISELVH